MGGDRNVSIGHDANGSVIITGDNNLNLVFPGISELSDEIIAKLRSGALRPSEVEGAVPLPALTLEVSFVDKTRQAWTIVARRPSEEPTERTLATPWVTQAGFAGALDDFWRLSRRALENDDEGALLDRQAHVLGDGLEAALSAEEVQLLIDIDPAARFSLVDLVSVKNFLEERLGREVDVVTRQGIDPAVAERVFREAETVF